MHISLYWLVADHLVKALVHKRLLNPTCSASTMALVNYFKQVSFLQSGNSVIYTFVKLAIARQGRNMFKCVNTELPPEHGGSF